MKNINSIMLENCEEYISLTLRTRNSKKLLRMLEENWKHSNQNLRVSWKPVNPQDCVWKNFYRITMRNILQERVTIHCNIKIWYTNLFLCLKPRVNTTPPIQQNIREKWLREASEMNYSITTRKLIGTTLATTSRTKSTTM